MSEQLFLRVPLESVTTAIKDGTHGTHSRVVEGVPFLSAKNITKSGLVYWDDTDDCIAESEYELIHKAFRLQPKDLLLTIVGSLGRRAIFDGSKVTFQRSVAYLRPDAGRVSERFLFHWFGHAEFQQELLRRSNSTAQAGLYLGELAQTLVPDCALSEQGQIADVLDTLDTTIRQTEAIIAKLKLVKQGLLHDLLTRGIDANGELRPPQSEAPHLYKASPLGWIPLEWDVGPLESSLERIIDYRGKTPEKTEIGVTLITARNVRLGFLDPEPREFIHETAFDSWMTRGIPKRGDILFTMEAPLGNVAQIETDERLAFAQRLVIMQTAQGVSSAFLKCLLLSEGFRKKLFALGSGSTVEGIQQSTLRRIPIALPTSLNEQDLIARRLSEVERRIDSEAAHMAKNQSLKSGLMNDLLTGRVRVTPLLAQQAA